MLDITNELRDVTSSLSANGIDYALCGGLAMSVFSRPRSTIDIDLLIRAESLEEVLAIATTMGYNLRGKELSFAKGAIEIRRVSKIDSSDGDLLSLDLLLVTPAIRSVWESRIDAEWEMGQLSVVSPKGLIALKRLRNSGQDQDDIRALLEEFPDAED